MDGMLDELTRVAEGLAFSEPRIPIVSNLTGEPVAAEEMCDPRYWARHARGTVRFGDGVRWLDAQGVDTFLELGPDGVLSAMSRDYLNDRGLQQPAESGGACTPVLRAGRPEEQTLLAGLAELWACGVPVDFSALYPGAARVRLPSYAFQRERYWLAGATGTTGVGDVAAAGLRLAEHPLLGAMVTLAEGEQSLLTGRISPETHPWLAEHVLMDTIVVPGAALLELALHACREVRCDGVQELIIQAPLVLTPHHARDIQVSVGSSQGTGERPLKIHSRPAGGDGVLDGQPWTVHVAGRLAEDRARCAQSSDVAPWPPPGALALDIEGLYDRASALGFAYGPTFQGIQAAWSREDEIFAEVALPATGQDQAARFNIHPALLDAALQSMAFMLNADGDLQPGEVRLPFSWSDVVLHRQSPECLRVSLRRTDGACMSLHAMDEAGSPVLSVDALALRAVSREQLQAATEEREESLFTLDWRAASAVAPETHESFVVVGMRAGAVARALARVGSSPHVFEDARTLAAVGNGPEDAPHAPGVSGGSKLVLLDCIGDLDSSPADDIPSRLHRACLRAVEMLQTWLSEEGVSSARLVVVTERAMAVGLGEDVVDPVAGAIWGLVRSVQREHPGRLMLVDLDGRESSWLALSGALALDEPQLALREGRPLVPRLALASSSEYDPVVFDQGDTVLITGGTGQLGGVLARHLVAKHRVRHLVLVSRRGPDAPGATVLERELNEIGARVRIAACDVSNRVQLQELLAEIGEEHPLRGVVHAAGVLDDGVLESLTPAGIDRVLSAKADSAWHLHELTAHLELTAFMLFSSIAGTLGSAGQGSYAAANAFLDGLAALRCGRGLPGISLAWGQWAQASAMTSHLGKADAKRLEQMGLAPLRTEEGLALFDAALACDRARAQIAPLRLNTTELHAQARSGVLHPLLHGLVRAPVRASEGEAGLSLERQLESVGEEDRESFVLGLVRSHVAIVLAHDSVKAIDAERPFRDLGFDSLAAVELRNRLERATGLRLPATTVFDHPTTARLAEYLLARVTPETALRHEQPAAKIEEADPLDEMSIDSLVRLTLGATEELQTITGIDDLAVAQRDGETS